MQLERDNTVLAQINTEMTTLQTNQTAVDAALLTFDTTPATVLSPADQRAAAKELRQSKSAAAAERAAEVGDRGVVDVSSFLPSKGMVGGVRVL
jgi:hypothetical protein